MHDTYRALIDTLPGGGEPSPTDPPSHLWNRAVRNLLSGDHTAETVYAVRDGQHDADTTTGQYRCILALLVSDYGHLAHRSAGDALRALQYVSLHERALWLDAIALAVRGHYAPGRQE